MKVLKAFAPGDLRVVEAAKPQPAAGQIKVAVRASGICGSDKWYFRNGPTDFIAGHEVAGEVVQLGPGVRRLRVGDRVAVNNVVGCGRCEACREGRFVRCPDRPSKDIDNGFSEFIVAPDRNCLVLDPRLDYEAGCLIFDNWGTPHAALERALVTPADKVVVSGCGPIGLAAVALAKLRGAFVVAVESLAYRRAAAIRLGADAAVEPGPDVVAAIRDLTGGGATVVMECSGKGPAYESGLVALGMEGRFLSVGEGAEFTLRPSNVVIRKNLSILGSWYSTMAEGAEVQAMMLDGRIAPSAFVTHRATLEDAPAAFARVCECADEVLKTVILMPGR
jgi:threonine dehydrogenase-like Zn-dependent dehydrogenase